MAKSNSELFRDPTSQQRDKARELVAALKLEGWSYTFLPFNVLGERVALKDPGNAGRLPQATRASFGRLKNHVEILAERSYARNRLMHRGQETESSRFLAKAFYIFPGSRLYFQ